MCTLWNIPLVPAEVTTSVKKFAKDEINVPLTLSGFRDKCEKVEEQEEPTLQLRSVLCVIQPIIELR